MTANTYTSNSLIRGCKQALISLRVSLNIVMDKELVMCRKVVSKCKWPTCDTLFIKQAVQTRLMLSKCCSRWPNTEPELGLRAVSVGIRLTYAVNCVSKGVESPAQSNLKQEESPRFSTTLLFLYLFKLLALYQRISLMLWDSILGFF